MVHQTFKRYSLWLEMINWNVSTCRDQLSTVSISQRKPSDYRCSYWTNFIMYNVSAPSCHTISDHPSLTKTDRWWCLHSHGFYQDLLLEPGCIRRTPWQEMEQSLIQVFNDVLKMSEYSQILRAYLRSCFWRNLISANREVDDQLSELGLQIWKSVDWRVLLQKGSSLPYLKTGSYWCPRIAI